MPGQKRSKYIAERNIHMRKIAAFLAAITAAVALTLPAMAIDSAKNVGEVPITHDTITIDGKKDKVYDQGLTFTVDLIGTETGVASSVTGKAYLLWDGTKSFYAYVEVTDATAVAWSESNYKSAPWNNDSVELFFDFKNNGSKRDQYRIDTNGSASYYGSSSVITNLSAYGFDGYACTKTSTGYAVEFKVSSYETTLAANGKVGIDWQVNDMQDATKRATIHYNSSLQAKGSVKSMDYVTLGTKVVAAPVETTSTATPTAPATLDISLVLAAVAAISGAGTVVLKKKH